MLVYQAFRYELAVTPAQRAVLANRAASAAGPTQAHPPLCVAVPGLQVRTARGAARPGPRVRQLLARPPHRPASGTTEVQEAGPLRGPVPADRRDPGTVRLGGPAAYWSGGHEGADRQVPRADPIGDLLPGG